MNRITDEDGKVGLLVMKVKVIHSNPEALDRVSRYEKALLYRTGESLQARICSVSVNVSLSVGIPFAEYDYHCTVQISTTQGHKITAEARDCDEILAVYRAVDKIRDVAIHQARVRSGENTDCHDYTLQ